MPEGLLFSTAVIPRRKFADDLLEGLVDPIEAEIVETEASRATDKAVHTIVLKFYGGGYTIGEPANVRAHNIRLAQLVGGSVKLVAPTYRLAPAEPYPCALHDAVSSFMWLIEEQGYQPSQIVVSGNSAGSNLAAALCVYLTLHDMPKPAGLALWTPFVDPLYSGPSTHTATQCILSGRSEAHVGGEDPVALPAYVPSRELLTDPVVSPLRADPAELKSRGFPPTWIEIGDVDRLRDDGILLYGRLTGAGIPSRCVVYAEATHFFAQEFYDPACIEAYKDLAAFVKGVVRLPGKENDGKPGFQEGFFWADHLGRFTDLGGLGGAAKFLQEKFDEYLSHIGDKERIRKAWGRFGFLEVWQSVVPGTFK
ncbi:Alpha/Beta hydrolase protein [Hyaloraphidium curvatum]|nr:Alpha/Beta hydrolase protein [Hyaloraphidium curvatum]